jgi:aspartate ammonia-lyase
MLARAVHRSHIASLTLREYLNRIQQELEDNLRTEHDSIGKIRVSDKVYWGPSTQRAISNFPVTGVPISKYRSFIRSYAEVKLACAQANHDLDLITDDQYDLISRACHAIMDGKHAEQFPVDVLQGGAGTSTNMNLNEVIANLALEYGGYPRGSYGVIHPNDVVNKSQSTNDTYPTALSIAVMKALSALDTSLEALITTLDGLASRYKDDPALGRTQLQDAVPFTYGAEFKAWADQIRGDHAAIPALAAVLSAVSLGGTAIGTGVNAAPGFGDLAVKHLGEITGLHLTSAANRIAAMTDMSPWLSASAFMRTLAVHLNKIADDLRLLASGPNAGLNEICLPAMQAGSSIMPGKVNPVIMESVNQAAFTVYGLDTMVTSAASRGQLQLNAFEPLIMHALLDGLGLLASAMDMMRTRAMTGLTVQVDNGAAYVEMSSTMSTFLVPVIGYEAAVGIAMRAAAAHRTIRAELMAEHRDDLIRLLPAGPIA